LVEQATQAQGRGLFDAVEVSLMTGEPAQLGWGNHAGAEGFEKHGSNGHGGAVRLGRSLLRETTSDRSSVFRNTANLRQMGRKGIRGYIQALYPPLQLNEVSQRLPPMADSSSRFGFVAFAETWNGRLAMLGFVIGLGTELLTGQGILGQIGLG